MWEPRLVTRSSQAHSSHFLLSCLCLADARLARRCFRSTVIWYNMSSRCQSSSSVVSNESSSSDERSVSSSHCRISIRSSNTPSIESPVVTTQRRCESSSPPLQNRSCVGQSRTPPVGPFDGSSRGTARIPDRHFSNDPSWLVSIRNLNRTGSPLRPSNLHLIQELQRRNVCQSELTRHSSPGDNYAGSSRPSYQRALSNTARSHATHSQQTSQRSLRSIGEESLRKQATYGSRSRGGALDASDHSAAADARIAAQRSKLMAQQQLTAYATAMRQATVKRAPPPPPRYQRRESLSSVDNTSIYSQHSHPSPPPPPPPPPLPPMPEDIGRLERSLYQDRSQGALRPGAYHHCPAPPPLPVRQLTGGRSSHSSSGPPMFGYDSHGDVRHSLYATHQNGFGYGSSRSIGLDAPSQHGRMSAHAGFRHPSTPDRYRQTSASDTYLSSANENPQEVKVEISPNVWVRLRGADETWACVEQDFFMPVVCFGCASELCCIQDADFVLCPTCRVVSPMNGIVDAASSDGGVGLGFTFDDLMKWQSDIVRTRQQQQQPQPPQRSQQSTRSRLGLLAS
jgi:hypothetical protein